MIGDEQMAIRSQLPTGTLTFLFTDIEGSTMVLQQVGEAYSALLADHHRLLRVAIHEFGGREVGTQGDSFFVVFERARDAVSAAITAQRALVAHRWPGATPLAVRMAVHTGEPEASGDGYVGLDVHRAARICSVASGGQILVSRTTRDLIQHDLPAGASLRDLGRHRLKDLDHAEHLYQVLASALPSEFPPVRSLDTLNNLPRGLTSFIGREREIAEIKRLLGSTRLLTLVGIGGAGKTRLALQVVGDIMNEYGHGVWLVKLGSVTDPAMVPQAVGVTLGLREDTGRPIMDALTAHLKSRHMILIFDNCEHLVTAVADLAEALLAAAPRLQILCTSREALGIIGETAWRVPSMSLPDPRRLPPLEQVKAAEAIQLFRDRANAVVPGFVITEANAAAVTKICARLDGIPLAIELAASRVKVLAVDQIADRLDDRFQLLSGGSRTAMPRHRTLRAVMDWSYDLLTPAEAAVLRGLAVFSGGCTLEAAEAVCSHSVAAPHQVLDILSRLVDKSLVIVEEDGREARYRMLEIVSQYALDRLVEANEASAARARHAAWVLQMLERAEPNLHGPEQALWMDRLDVEYDNARGAMEWAIDRGDGETALRIGCYLWWFWIVRGSTTEGCDWLVRAMVVYPARTRLRAEALARASLHAFFSGNVTRAEQMAQEALELARELGAESVVALALGGLSLAAGVDGDHQRATALAREAREIYRARGEGWSEASIATVLGLSLYSEGDAAGARGVIEEALAKFRSLGDVWGIAFAQRLLGQFARTAGDYEAAAVLQQQSLELNQALGYRWGVGASLLTMALVPLRQGDYAKAASLLEDALAQLREIGDNTGIAETLYYLGLTSYYRVDVHRARTLLSESLAEFRKIGARDGMAQALTSLGRVALQQDDVAQAEALGRESLTVLGDGGSRWPRAYALRLLAGVALRRGDLSRAEMLVAESLEIYRALKDGWAINWALQLCGEIALMRGAYHDARVRFAESLAGRKQHGDKLGMAESLEGIAAVIAYTAPSLDAVCVLGAAEALRDAIAAPLPPVDEAWYGDAVRTLRMRLPAPDVESAWARGRAMSPADAVALALGQQDRVAP
jgi:predicted ATPase/class 3 adenylate cyclase